MHHRHQSGSEVIAKEYALLDANTTNPVMKKVVIAQDLGGVFYKHHGHVINYPFQRSHTFKNCSINQVLEKLFLKSDFLCDHLTRDGWVAFDRNGVQYKLKTPHDHASFTAAAQAQSAGENFWLKRYGMGKNFLPRLSPISWWVYIAEDQHIRFDPERGIITATMVALSVDLGEHFRTIRHFRMSAVGPDVEVIMQFGAINAWTGKIDRDATSIRDQAFSETHDPNWKWAMRAEEALRK